MSRGPDLQPRKLRPAPVRDGLRPSAAIPKRERAADYRAILKATGRCVCCYKARGKRATALMCRRCANRHAARMRARNKRLRETVTE